MEGRSKDHKQPRRCKQPEVREKKQLEACALAQLLQRGQDTVQGRVEITGGFSKHSLLGMGEGEERERRDGGTTFGRLAEIESRAIESG